MMTPGLLSIPPLFCFLFAAQLELIRSMAGHRIDRMWGRLSCRTRYLVVSRITLDVPGKGYLI